MATERTSKCLLFQRGFRHLRGLQNLHLQLSDKVEDIRFLSMPKRKELWNNRFDSI